MPLSCLEDTPSSSSHLVLPGHWANADKLVLLSHGWARGSPFRSSGFNWVILAVCVNLSSVICRMRIIAIVVYKVLF